MATKSQTAMTENKVMQPVEKLVELTELALKFRNGEAGKITMAEVVRMTGRASRLLRIKDLDERLSVENSATMVVAKAHQLIS